jgi:hypothetical protein
MKLNIDCDGDCRVTEVGCSMSTALHYPPIYDKDGNNTNPDGNITSGDLRCYTCGREWSYKTQYGKTSLKEVEQNT